MRGGRRGRSLQPFAFLRIGWTGRSTLGTLTSFEVDEQYWLKGRALASAFYLAELMMRLVSERESHPRLFAGLKWAFENMEQDLEPVLRSFEKLLLEDLGYGLDFTRDTEGDPMDDSSWYTMDPERGFSVVAGDVGAGYPGSALSAIAREEFADPVVRKQAKRIFRIALRHFFDET